MKQEIEKDYENRLWCSSPCGTTFGYEMPGRTYGSDYKFNFNGKEDDKWNGNGSSYLEFGARIQDARLGRFFSGDPKGGKYPNYSPYLFAGNRPIVAIDYNGEGPKYKTIANVFGKRLKEIKNVSFSVYDQSDVNKQIIYNVNLTINGQTISKQFVFNEKDKDGDYERLLIDWGVDNYDAIIAASNSISKQVRWSLLQADEHYGKMENGLVLAIKTPIALMGIASLIEFAEVSVAEQFLIGLDWGLKMDDLSSFFTGQNSSLLKRLLENTGGDPDIVDKIKAGNDVLQGLNDRKKVLEHIDDAIKGLEKNSKNNLDKLTESIQFMNSQVEMQKHYWKLMMPKEKERKRRSKF